MTIKAALDQLVRSAQGYVAAVDAVRGPLEADLRAAVEACWEMQEKQVQLPGKPFLRKKVRLLEAKYQAAADEAFLAPALKQWQDAAEGTVAAAALEVRIAERRLLHGVNNVIETEHSLPQLLEVLSAVLSSVESMGAPIMISCPSTFSLLRTLALYVGVSILELEGTEDELYGGLMRTLRSHAERTDWALALLQPPADLLQALLQELMHTVDSSEEAYVSGRAKGQRLNVTVLLLEQLPWDAAVRYMGVQAASQHLLPPLYCLLDICTAAVARGEEDSEDLLVRLLCVLTSLMRQMSGSPAASRKLTGHVLLALMAVSRGCGTQTQREDHPQLASMCGAMDDRPQLIDPEGVCWAWMSVAWSNSSQQGAAAVFRVMQSLPWGDLGPLLPGHLVCLLNVSVTKGLQYSSETVAQSFVDWVWSLLASPLGSAMLAVQPDDDDDIAAMLSLTCSQTPKADERLSALWELQCTCMAVRLLACWTGDLRDNLGGPCDAPHEMPRDVQQQCRNLLEGSHLVQTLTTMSRTDKRGQAMATDMLLQLLQHVSMCPVDVSSSMVPELSRLMDVLMMEEDVENMAGQEAHTGLAACATRQVFGIMVNNLSHSTPTGSPGGRPGSHMFPFVRLSCLWCSLLCNSAANRSGLLPPAAGTLLNDLTQLLFYYWPDIATTGHDSVLAKLVMGLGMEHVRSLVRRLMQLYSMNPKGWMWLPLLAAWLQDFCTLCHLPHASSMIDTPSGVMSPAGVMSPSGVMSPQPSGQRLVFGSEDGRTDGLTAHSMQQNNKEPMLTAAAASLQATLMNKIAEQKAAHEGELALSQPNGQGHSVHSNSSKQQTGSSMESSAGEQLASRGLTKGAVSESFGKLLTAVEEGTTQDMYQVDDEEEEGDGDAGATQDNDRVPLRTPTSLIDDDAESQLSGGRSSLYSPRMQSVGVPGGHGSELMAAREAEAALQLHEVARGLGATAVSLCIWEEFLVMYASVQHLLTDMISKEDLSKTMSRLAEHFEGNSPALASVTTRWAPMDPGALIAQRMQFEGRTSNGASEEGPHDQRDPRHGHHALRLLSLDRQAVAEVMMAHPLRIGAMNPSRRTDVPQDAIGPPFTCPVCPSFPRRPPVTPDTFMQLQAQQADVMEDLRDVRALLRCWSCTAERKAATGSQGYSAMPESSEAYLLGFSDEDADVANSDTAADDGDGGVPETIAEAQTKLWDCTVSFGTELSSLSATLRGLVRVRYHPVHLELLNPDRFQGGELLDTPEDPSYMPSLQTNREQAAASISRFAEGEGLAAAAGLLHQVEVMLLHPHSAEEDHQEGTSSLEVSMKSRLLAVVARVMLDGSTPPIALPFLRSLYHQATTGALKLDTYTKLAVLECVVDAASFGGNTARGPSEGPVADDDAVSLSRALMTQKQWLEAGKLLDYFLSFRCVIRHAPADKPHFLEPLLRDAQPSAYVSAALDRGLLDIGQEPMPEPQSPSAESAAAGVATGSHIGGPQSLSGPSWGMMVEIPSELGGTSAFDPAAASSSAMSHTYDSSGPDAVALPGRCVSEGMQARAPAHVEQLLSLAMLAMHKQGGSAFGQDLAEAIVCSNPVAYFAAVCGLACVHPLARTRQQLLTMLASVPQDVLPLPVILEAAKQMTYALGKEQLQYHDVPSSFLQLLLTCSSMWEGVSAELSGRQPPEQPGVPAFALRNSKPAADSATGRGGPQYVRYHLAPLLSEPSPSLVLQQLVGGLLQGIARAGAQTRSFNDAGPGAPVESQVVELLQLVLTRVSDQPHSPDWVWLLYVDQLQPFLCLTLGPASEAVLTFREVWLSLPWSKATFFCQTPKDLTTFGSHLESADGAAIDLLPLLDWRRVLEALSPLHDTSMQELSPLTREWATEFALFALRTCVLLQPEDLPAFLRRIIWEEGLMWEAPYAAEGSSQDGVKQRRLLTLAHALACSDWERLGDVVLQQAGDTPWLLHPLMHASRLISGVPGYRIVHALRKLRSGAESNASPLAASVTAQAARRLLFVCIVHSGAADLGGRGPGGRESADDHVWHLSMDEHEEILCGVMMPLAMMHSTPLLLEQAGCLDPDAFADLCASPRPSGATEPNLDAAYAASALGNADPEVGGNGSPAGVTLACLLSVVRAPLVTLTASTRFDWGNADVAIQPGRPPDTGILEQPQVLHVQLMQAKLASTLLESCKRGPLIYPACLLRIGLSTPALRDSLRAMQLMEMLLHLALLRLTQQRGMGGDSDGPVGPPKLEKSSIDLLSEKSLRLTATNDVDVDEDRGWSGGGAGHVEEDDPLADDLIRKVMATCTVPQLIATAAAATRARAPLVTAAALEGLRQAVLTADLVEWEAAACAACAVASASHPHPDLHEHLLSVWLEVLNWAEDSRMHSSTPDRSLQQQVRELFAALATFVEAPVKRITAARAARGNSGELIVGPGNLSSSTQAMQGNKSGLGRFAGNMVAKMRAGAAGIGQNFTPPSSGSTSSGRHSRNTPPSSASSAQSAAPPKPLAGLLGPRWSLRRAHDGSPLSSRPSSADASAHLSSTLLAGTALDSIGGSVSSHFEGPQPPRSDTDEEATLHPGTVGKNTGFSRFRDRLLKNMQPSFATAGPDAGAGSAVVMIQNEAAPPATLHADAMMVQAEFDQFVPMSASPAYSAARQPTLAAEPQLLSPELQDDMDSSDVVQHDSIMIPTRRSRRGSVNLDEAVAAQEAVSPRAGASVAGPAGPPGIPGLAFLERLRQPLRAVGLRGRQGDKPDDGPPAGGLTAAPQAIPADMQLRLAVAAFLIGHRMLAGLSPALRAALPDTTVACFLPAMLQELQAVPAAQLISPWQRILTIMDDLRAPLDAFQGSIQGLLFPHGFYMLRSALP